jgi:hypothetical protein
MRDELKALAEALWLREPRRPVSSIHRQVAREAQSPGASAPSYDQVLAVVRPRLFCVTLYILILRLHS